MAEITKVALLQEEFRDMLRDAQQEKPGGHTLDEMTLVLTSSYPSEDAVVNMASAMYEVFGDANGKKIETLRDAMSVIDHLHTLGMEVRFKVP